MEIELTQDAQEDLAYWRNIHQDKILARIRQLLESISETPFQGIGKPEPLKYQLASKWSRRINDEHRIIYEVRGNTIYVSSLRGHY